MLTDEIIHITTIDPAPKKRGRPLGSKNKTASKATTRKVATRKPKSTPKMRNPKKVDKFAIAVSAQHYWLISALAEARNVPRNEVLEGIINKFIAKIGETA